MTAFVIVRGNIGQSVTLKSIKRSDLDEFNQVLNFSIASTQYKRIQVDGKEKFKPTHIEWFECEYWNRQAEHLNKILKKGMPITVYGKELIEIYEKNGQTNKYRKIRIENIYLNLDSLRIESINIKAPSAGSNEEDISADAGEHNNINDNNNYNNN